jgi:streptogramin lyase
VKKFLSPLAALLLPAWLGAQTISGVGAVLHPLNRHITDTDTNLITFADGPRLVPSDGGIWFLEANADRIAFFKNDVVTEWPIRSHDYRDPYRSIGANPADFELDPDGKTIWFVENGNSGIDVNESIFARLDTTTDALTEWILPISKPAGFLRLPGGIVWLPMSQGSLVKLDLNTLAVVAYRGSDSLGYSGMILGPDSDFYLSDYGSNRLVRIDPQTLTETAWQPFDPVTKGRVNMSQPTLDGAGNFWIAEDVNGGSLARLSLATGEYDRFGAGNLLSPTHFFVQGNLVYAVETDSLGGDGRIVVVDTNTVNVDKVTTTPKSASLVTLPLASATFRTTTLTPITFQSSDSPPDGLVVASSPQTGISRFTLPHGTVFPSTTSYSIATIGGKVLAGVRGALTEFTLLPEAPPTDLVVPVAVNSANTVIRTDFLFFNSKAQTGKLTATFYSSPVPPSPSKGYTFGAGVTFNVENALGPAELKVGDAAGSVRFTPFSGDEGAYQALTRSYALVANNGSYGFSLPAQLVSAGVTAGSALFLHTQSDEASSFGIYSPTGGSGTATLHGADGATRGSYSFFLPANNRQEFDPAFSAFGASAEAGSYITFSLSSGSLFPFSAIRQQTGDVAVALPVAPATTAIFPVVGARTNGGGSSNITDILLANSDFSNAATATLTFYPLDPAKPSSSASVTLPPGSSRTVPYRDPAEGFGALVVAATIPVCAQARYANHTPAGDYAGLASPVAPVAHARFLLSPDPHLRNNLMIFNGGDAGRANVLLYDAAGALQENFGFAMVPHRLLILFDVSSYSNLSNGGRIEVFSDEGAQLSSWLASSDRVTGDPDAQPPQAVP